MGVCGVGAGTETEYYTGDGETALAEAGRYDGNSGGETHALGERKENKWGLYDMHGNVWEWCRDAWDEDAYKKREDGVVEPEVTAEYVGEQAPLRGGSWGDGADGCRSSIRDWEYGFRVCLVRSTTAKMPPDNARSRSRPKGGTKPKSTRRTPISLPRKWFLGSEREGVRRAGSRGAYP